MDNGASSYRRYLSGDDQGIAEIVEEYRVRLILYLNTFVRNYSVAEDLAEEAFFRLITKKPRFPAGAVFTPFFAPSAATRRWTICERVGALPPPPLRRWPTIWRMGAV